MPGLAKLDARVAKFAEKCHVASPKARCSAVKERLSARLAKIEARLDARIAKAQKPERKAKLQAARDHVASLLASLSRTTDRWRAGRRSTTLSP